MNKHSNWEKIGIVLTIVVLIAIIVVSNNNSTDTSFQTGLSKVVMPIQKLFSSIGSKFSGNDAEYDSIEDLKAENEKLKTEIEGLKTEKEQIAILKAENKQLKEVTNLKEKYKDYTTQPATIINRDISNYNENFIIDVGTEQGVNINMPVIAEEGLVGHIISVTDNTAKVQTIIDTASSLSCTIQTTGDNIIARGSLEEGTELKATYIPTTAQLLQGDVILTSGIGGIYPKGITIGTVQKVVQTQNITDRYAQIKTAVDFSKISNVLVLK